MRAGSAGSLVLMLVLAGCAATPAPAPSAPAPGAQVQVPELAALAPAKETKAGPDYGAVFFKDRVPAVTLKIAPADWEKMLADMQRLFGKRGLGTLDKTGTARFGDGQKPLWVPADVVFDGKAIAKVGLRFKGWGSLQDAWKRGTDRLSFKLDFDQFEDDYPETKNQRLHGFKQLMLTSGIQDPTTMREMLACEAYADAGVPVGETGFCKVTLDRGGATQNLGVYTLMEGIDDTAIPRLFGGKKGSLYESEGDVATFAEGTRDALKKGLVLEDGADVGSADVLALYDALHDPARTSAPAAWRQRLEGIFNVDTFLAWLAVSAVIEHYDTYGNLAHNFYLYNDPLAGNRLQWVTWDHNWSQGLVTESGQTSAEKAGPMDQRDITARYPLIRFLMDDPVYRASYNAHMRKSVDGALGAATYAARVARLTEVLRPAYAEEPGGATGMEQAARALSDYMVKRSASAVKYLDGVK